MQLCILGTSPCESVSTPWEDVHDTGPLDEPRPGLSQSRVTSPHLWWGPLCTCGLCLTVVDRYMPHAAMQYCKMKWGPF